MSLKQYRALVETVESGSVTKAAAKLNISQSALTQLLNSLEKELGIVLINRSRSGVTLTDKGRSLYSSVVRVLKDDEHVRELAFGLAKENIRTIRIASFTSVAVNWLPEIIKAFSPEEPDTRIELVEGEYNDIPKSFTRQHIDFGFVPLPVELECTCFPLYEDRLLAVLPIDTDESDLTYVDGELRCPVTLFETRPVISLSENIDRDARSVFTRAGITPNIRYRVEDDYAMPAMVEKGLGICIVPELIMRGSDRRVMTLPLEPAATRTIGIAFPDYEGASDVARKFFEFTKAYIKAVSGSVE